MEREFRLRQQFTEEIHIYQFVMLSGVWLTLNFIMKVNRKRNECQAMIEGRESAGMKKVVKDEVVKDEAPKSKADKKDD